MSKKTNGFEGVGQLVVAQSKQLAELPRSGTIQPVNKNVPIYAEKSLVEMTMDFPTHQISYMTGTILVNRTVSGTEAKAALTAWNRWRPVPVPNPKDPNRSAMFIAPDQIKSVRRMKYVDTDGGILHRTEG